jgi:poly(3-hydroxybutyrate) depolymerase
MPIHRSAKRSSRERRQGVARGATALLLLLLVIQNRPVSAVMRDDSAHAAGCGRPAGTGMQSLAALDGNHTERSFQVQVPVDYHASRRYPLVFVFHGAGGGPADSAGWGLQNVRGAASRAIFVFPQGIDFQHQGPGWDDRSDGYDLPFFDDMLTVLAAEYCVDPARVFVAGFSWGGDFAIALACNRGDAIRAVAANSTTDDFKDPADFMTYLDLPCQAHRHPPIRFVHAEDGDALYPPPDFAATSRLLRYLGGCAAASSPTQSSAVVSCRAFKGCSGEYVECTFDHGIGHTLPPHWAEETWAFFLRHMR